MLSAIIIALIILSVAGYFVASSLKNKKRTTLPESKFCYEVQGEFKPDLLKLDRFILYSLEKLKEVNKFTNPDCFGSIREFTIIVHDTEDFVYRGQTYHGCTVINPTLNLFEIHVGCTFDAILHELAEVLWYISGEHTMTWHERAWEEKDKLVKMESDFLKIMKDL